MILKNGIVGIEKRKETENEKGTIYRGRVMYIALLVLTNVCICVVSCSTSCTDNLCGMTLLLRSS